MRKMLLCNLNWGIPEQFSDFDVAGYQFRPISKRQPQHRTTYTPSYADRCFRRHVVNAYAILPGKEAPSTIFEGRGFTVGRQMTFLDDLLAVLSILIPRNVRRSSERRYGEFPLSAGNQLKGLASNSTDLQKHLQPAVAKLAEEAWRRRHDGGFHILLLLAASNVVHKELRFLGYITIWEYLFFCHHRNLSEQQLKDKPLEQKLDYLTREFHLADRQYKSQVEKLGLFSRLRHQVAHGGILRTASLPGALQGVSPSLCLKYIDLFNRVTENLVLATLDIKSTSESWALNELLRYGSVAGYEQEVKTAELLSAIAGRRRRGIRIGTHCSTEG